MCDHLRVPNDAPSATAPKEQTPAAIHAIPRLSALTGIRIFAALAVYASHLGPPHGSPGGLRAFFASGYMGVTLFFTLSGFVLAINYFDALSHPSARRIWNYAIARFARIYPLYVLVLLYFIVHDHAFGVSVAGWWQHVLAIQAWSPNIATAYGFNGPAWSVSVEFFLYACVPFLFPVLAKLRSPQAALIAAAIVALAMTALTAWFVATGRGNLPWANPGSAHRWLYRTPLTRLGDFTLGILAARLYVMTRGRAGLSRIGAPLALAAATVTIVLMSWPSDVDSPWSWDVIYAVPAVMLIFGLAVAPRSLPARLLSLPIIVLLGESSYAFYLVHQFTLVYFGADRWAVATSPTTVLYEMFTLGAILCLAVGLHVVIERPARIFIRRWASWIPATDRPPPSARADRGPLPVGIGDGR
jgi:peptidoglycan/LPS O-acetylase OafA/YrhL